MNVELFNFDTPAHTARNHQEHLGHQTCVGRGISAAALAIAQCVHYQHVCDSLQCHGPHRFIHCPMRNQSRRVESTAHHILKQTFSPY